MTRPTGNLSLFVISFWVQTEPERYKWIVGNGRLLVTGVPGFVGSWTWRHWQEAHQGVKLYATSNLSRPEDIPVDRHHQLDLCDYDAVRNLIDVIRPTQIIHLAGLVGSDNLADNLSVNVVGTDNLYRAVIDANLASECKIVQVGSAAIYGHIEPDEIPLTESQQLRPLSPYAISKAAQDQLARARFLTDGLRIVRARVFNLLGPGQPDCLVPMAFVLQLKQCQDGSAECLEVGNIETTRDFVDVRDVAEAFDALLRHGRDGEAYNVGSGQDISIREIIERIMAVSDVTVPIKSRPARIRRADVPRVQADITKITSDTGWQPRRMLDESLADMWNSPLAD